MTQLSHSQQLFEFGMRRTLSPEADLVHQCATWWWCTGIDRAPSPGVLATVALNVAAGPVDGAVLSAEGDRYTELLTGMIQGREAAWAKRTKKVLLRKKGSH